MKYFTICELYQSSTAAEKHIDNTPPAEIVHHLEELTLKLLDPIREAYGKPIKVTSCYRCKALNTAIGGATSSSHMYGYAADIKPVSGSMRDLQEAILRWAKTSLFDQIILEQCNDKGIASWIHVGYRHGVTGKQRHQYLKARKVNGKWSYKAFEN